jgi:hypothetical protein
MRQKALETCVAEWSETDPKSAAEFAVHNSTGDTRENLLAKISYQWAQSNPAAALAWAQNLSETTGRDAVVPGLVSVVAEDNPGSAAERIAASCDIQPLAASSLVSQWAGPIRRPRAPGRLPFRCRNAINFLPTW